MNRFKVIDDETLPQIHDASLKVLEETGVAFHHDAVLDIFKSHGAKVDGQTVRLPRTLVEKAMDQAPSKFTWTARNPAHTKVLGEGWLLQPAAGTVKVHDLDGNIRPGTLSDYRNFQKIYQAGDVFDLVGMIPVEPSELPAETKHLHMMYETLKHTDKPVNGFMTTGDQARAQLEMGAIAVGGTETFTSAHYMCVSIGATTPLTYSWDPLETMMQYVAANQVPTILCAPLAGVTAPYSMLGTAVLQNAELLAGIVLVQLLRPGHPAVYCPSAAAANMKTCGFATGAPESMLINTANIQMALDFYHIPVRAMPGFTDAKIPDFQAGVETMQNLMMGMLSGAHLLNESVGILDSILTVSYEKTLLDAEIISRIKRIGQGIDGPDTDLAGDAIRTAGQGGSFLMDPATVINCRNRWSPSVSFWGTQQEWEADGGRDVAARANDMARNILDNAPERLIDGDTDRALKAYMERENGCIGVPVT
ncbi:MAG: trimethylamine methyltransferase family protein [Desulfobacterales bacterium]|nr:trimethylamine methyltransferase family protein [Desulfobacterales bacterium]